MQCGLSAEKGIRPFEQQRMSLSVVGKHRTRSPKAKI